MKKYNYIVSVVMLLLSGYIFYESSGYTIGSSAQKNPAVWPCILAGALALLSVALIIETALKKEPGEEKKTIDWKSPGMIHVYIMLGIVVGFVVLMKIVGMLLALLIMIPAIEYLMGCRSKVMLITLPVGMVAFVYLFFVVAMEMSRNVQSGNTQNLKSNEADPARAYLGLRKEENNIWILPHCHLLSALFSLRSICWSFWAVRSWAFSSALCPACPLPWACPSCCPLPSSCTAMPAS